MAESTDPGLPVSCECGYIKMRTPTSQPLGTAHCHCNTCRKQSASVFGTSVYFHTKDVFPLSKELEDKFSIYRHPTDIGNTMNCFFCPRCGVRVLHVADMPDGSKRAITSFKGGVIDEGIDWKGLRTKHIFTESAVMELPKEWECYDRYPADLMKPTAGATSGGGTDEKGKEEKA